MSTIDQHVDRSSNTSTYAGLPTLLGTSSLLTAILSQIGEAHASGGSRVELGHLTRILRKGLELDKYDGTVSDVEHLSTTVPATACGAGAPRQNTWPGRVGVLVTAVLAVVIGLTVPVVVIPRPVGADQISDLQTQAAQLSQDILKQQLEVGGLQQQYGVATQRVQNIGDAIDSTRKAVTQNQQQIGRDFHRLREAALFTYMTSGTATGNSTSQIFASNQQTVEVKNVYQNLVAGDVNVALDQLHSDQANLRQHQQALHQEHSQAVSAQQQADGLMQHSVDVEQQLQGEQSQVKGQLAAAIAAQQAAEEAAAQAAIRAAQQQAAAQAAAAQRTQVQQSPQPTPSSTTAPSTPATTAPQTPTPAAAPGPATTTAPAPTTTTAQPTTTTTMPAPTVTSSGGNPSLPPFLQCALQAESGGNYGVVSANGQYFGGFQFSQAAWNEAAQLAGMPNLIGTPPNQATSAEQDELAIALYSADGSAPWYDPCSGH